MDTMMMTDTMMVITTDFTFVTQRNMILVNHYFLIKITTLGYTLEICFIKHSQNQVISFRKSEMCGAYAHFSNGKKFNKL